MANWILLSLAASLLWGIVNILDKVILTRFSISPWAYLVLDGLLGIIPIALFLFVNPLSLSPRAIVLSLLSGVFLLLFNLLYFQALRLSDVAIIGILIQFAPVFSLGWGLLLLNEAHGVQSYFGMILVFLGTVIAASSESKPASTASPSRSVLAAALMLLATFGLSLAYLLQKLALARGSDPFLVFAWQRLALFLIAGLIVAGKSRLLSKITIQPVLLAVGVALINLAGFLLITVAYSVGNLSDVTFFASLQPAWILLILWVLQLLHSSAVPRIANLSMAWVVFACGTVVCGLYLMR